MYNNNIFIIKNKIVQHKKVSAKKCSLVCCCAMCLPIFPCVILCNLISSIYAACGEGSMFESYSMALVILWFAVSYTHTSATQSPIFPMPFFVLVTFCLIHISPNCPVHASALCDCVILCNIIGSILWAYCEGPLFVHW